jgi:hypothetical protein
MVSGILTSVASAGCGVIDADPIASARIINRRTAALRRAGLSALLEEQKIRTWILMICRY